MRNNRTKKLIERVATEPGVPETLSREIVHLAQRHLKAAGRGLNPQYRDVTWAVSQAWREWSRRFSAALEARAGKTALDSAA
ncbi:MAG: hypothetical protein GY719_35975 [bacterium]|nr:hypothetical protein [bacterium]